MLNGTQAFVQAARTSSVLRLAHVAADDPHAMPHLAAALGDARMALVMLFASPFPGIRDLPARAAAAFPATPVIGCTTAGEISPDGYAEGADRRHRPARRGISASIPC